MIPEGPTAFFGVYAATPAPLTNDFALDEASLRTLLAELAAVPGLAGFLVNGHAGENPSMPLADCSAASRRSRPRRSATGPP